MSDLKQLDETYVAGTYARFPVALMRGEGSLVYDEDGKRYIDMGSGIGVTAFGIADQQWQQAVTAQLGVLQHTSNLYYTQPCVLLAQQLCQKNRDEKGLLLQLRRRGQRMRHQNRTEICLRQKGAGILHHRHPGKQLPRADHHHPGRHRSGPLSRTVPAPDPGLRPNTRSSVPPWSRLSPSTKWRGFFWSASRAKEAWYP